MNREMTDRQTSLALVVAGSYDAEEDRLLRSAGIEVKLLPGEIDEQAAQEMRVADALLLGVSLIAASIIAEAPRLKIIAGTEWAMTTYILMQPRPPGFTLPMPQKLMRPHLLNLQWVL